MDKLVAQFPKQIADAILIASRSELSFDKNKTFNNVVICGMGGSGIGGKMVAQLFGDQAKLPIVLVQNYQIPAFVDDSTLVIASSYSGNTEETLSVTKQADEKGATIVGVSSGGELIQFCKKNEYEFIKLPGGNPPRSMLAFSAVQLIHILSVAGVIDKNALDLIAKARHFLNDELIHVKNQAKALANHIYEKQSIFYTNSSLEFVAIRARQQINENSKQLCWHHVIPEMNHNELVGWAGGNEHFAPVFFVSQFLNNRNKTRTKLSQEIIQNKCHSILSIEGRGKTKIEESLYFIHIIDWASLFLADKRGVDPVEVKVIDYLKRTLDKK
ncbi:bifunctional phosphoglucose/phosphomannose isomerase [Brumimicrobium salinarum]|uniref:Bifunctional phosphoglucose/phosphomannose isomerase n=1 Tax=Brumimicrobium salinarum TaxID=2058658 RepID=A0A2I0R6Q7_9FLAO|nr:bifunctional phosphoglucose/phosphomannose isomerase [Brumimicrobium salinarum]PKR82271.1 bifunctional phosphoglucose/phosphomannose isomerase [Brumimicrobium salinarum]